MKILLLLSLMMLCACSAQLRFPVCRETSDEFPESVRGNYKMVVPGNSNMNQSIELQEVEFELRKDGIYYSEDQKIPAPAMGLAAKNVCMINGEVYVQRLNDNSTYSLAKLEPTSYGLMVNDITFDFKEMKEYGVPVYNLPTVKWWSGHGDKPGNWEKDISDLGKSPIIYDNRNLSPETTARLGRITSVRIMFERTPSTKLKKLRILLSDLKRRNRETNQISR